MSVASCITGTIKVIWQLLLLGACCAVGAFVVLQGFPHFWGFSALPTTLSLMVAFTVACEVFPHCINDLNSNVGTSQVQWNVGTPAYNYQLMNYILYHRKPPAILGHGITFIADGLLWMMYFHYMLQDVIVWRYAFIFFLCLTQALTFSDKLIRLYLIGIFTCYWALNYLVVSPWAFPVGSAADAAKTEHSFALVSWGLLGCALIRVLSHLPEDLPIHFFDMDNTKPIPNWWKNTTVLKYYWDHKFTFAFVFFLAILSELQAGFPVRLVGACWVMILAKIKGGIDNRHTNLSILTNTADYITDYGFIEDRHYKIIEPPQNKDVYKWMDTAPDNISFERMITNAWPLLGENIAESTLGLTPVAGPLDTKQKKQKKQDTTPSTPVAGGDEPKKTATVEPKKSVTVEGKRKGKK